ncbi:hypothetical protein JXA84_03575 [candidate division WOR-3 bacterium]|nr:hypothetical protein [candidate division WOR-3 bacterium]
MIKNIYSRIDCWIYNPLHPALDRFADFEKTTSLGIIDGKALCKAG